MLEAHLKSPVTQRRLRSGPAADYIDEFADWLYSNGYTDTCIEYRLQALARWTDWMTVMGLSSQAWFRAFEDYKDLPLKPPRPFRCSVGATKDSIIAAKVFISFLQQKGHIPPPVPPPSYSDLWSILCDFRSWMLKHRGVTVKTLDIYERTLVRLLNALGTDTNKYSAKALRDFVLDEARPYGIWRAKGMCVAIRSFCRFLSVSGQCSPGLEHGLPGFPSYELSSIPRYLAAADVERLIASCDTYTFGVRDKAILLLLARLGLRASDVANLRLADIDWRKATITVSGKGRREEFLPLTQEVGDAILLYLNEGRRRLQIPEVFITVKAPHGPLLPRSITQIVKAALVRAGIKTPLKGAHLLRHSADTTMLRQGAPLASIGAVLRHRSFLETTARYAKVDFDLLSEIAQPWPRITDASR